jgi:tetratricopeptide (TPR) repeat protein
MRARSYTLSIVAACAITLSNVNLVWADALSYLNSLNQANKAFQSENWTAAERFYKLALQQVEPQNLISKASLNESIGTSIYNQGRLAESEPFMREALQCFAKIPSPNMNEEMIYIGNLANTCDRIGKYADAATLTRQRIDIYSQIHPGDSAELARMISYEAREWSAYGDSLRAKDRGEQAYAMFERVHDTNWMAMQLQNNATGEMGTGNLKEAEAHLKRSVELRKLDPNLVSLSLPMAILAALYVRESRFPEAEMLYKEVLDLRIKNMPKDHPYIAEVLQAMTNFYLTTNEPDKAEACLNQAIEVVATHNEYLVSPLLQLSDLCMQRKQYGKAEVLYKKAMSIEEQTFGQGGRKGTNRVRVLALKSFEILQNAIIAQTDEEWKQYLLTVADQPNRAALTQLDEACKTQPDPASATATADFQKLKIKLSDVGALNQTQVLSAVIKAEVNAGNIKDATADAKRLLDSFRKEKVALSLASIAKQLESALICITLKSPSTPIFVLLEPLTDAGNPYHARVLLELGMNFEAAQGPGVTWIKQADEQLQKAGPAPNNKGEFELASTTTAIALAAEGQSIEASKMASQAAEYLDSKSELPPITRIKTLFSLVDLSRLQGDFNSAILFARYAEKLAQGQGPRVAGDCQLKLSQIALDQQDYSQSMTLASNAETLLAKVNDKVDYAAAINIHSKSLANSAELKSVAERKRMLEEALALSQKSLSLYETVSDKSQQSLTTIKLQQACLLLDLGRYDAAMTILEKARDEALGFHDAQGRAVLGDVYSAMGELELRRGKIAEAQSNYIKALEAHGKDSAPEAGIATATDLNALACISAMNNNFADAQNKIMRGSAIVDTYVKNVFPQLSFAEQRAFLSDIRSQMRSLIAVTMANPEMSTGTYTYLFHWRGLLIESIRRFSVAAAIHDAKSNDHRYDVLLNRLAILRTKLSNLANSDSPQTQLQVFAEKWTSEKEVLERELSRKMTADGFKVEDLTAELTYEKFQSLLSKSETVADVYQYNPITPKGFGPSRYMAFIIHSSGVPQLIDLGDELAMNQAITDWRTICCNSTGRGSGISGHKTPREGDPNIAKAILKKGLWEPIVQAIGQSNSLMICDEGELSRFPWIVLNEESEKTNIALVRLDSPRELVNLRLQSEHQGGIGVELKQDKVTNRVFISNVLKDSPAEKAGIESGEVISSINGVGAELLVLDEVATKIRGKVDSKIRLEVLKNGVKRTFDLDRSILSKHSLLKPVPSHSIITSDNDGQMVVVGGVKYGDPSLYLPHTLDEFKAVSEEARIGKFKVIPLKAEGATVGEVVSNLPKVRLAHFATHGFFADNDGSDAPDLNVKLRSLRRSSGGGMGSVSVRNPLVESGLLFAPEPLLTRKVEPAKSVAKSSKSSASRKQGVIDNDPTVRDTGRLSAEELVGLNLQNCDLVVLSACDTGRGEEEIGQGVLGLRAALMAAGARSVLISLWKVNDEATELLMKDFYHHLLFEHKSKAESLNEAQSTIRKIYPKPADWAAWTLVGEGW